VAHATTERDPHVPVPPRSRLRLARGEGGSAPRATALDGTWRSYQPHDERDLIRRLSVVASPKVQHDPGPSHQGTIRNRILLPGISRLDEPIDELIDEPVGQLFYTSSRRRRLRRHLAALASCLRPGGAAISRAGSLAVDSFPAVSTLDPRRFRTPMTIRGHVDGSSVLGPAPKSKSKVTQDAAPRPNRVTPTWSQCWTPSVLV
jgi:hypothetical protein